jgi:hypothetical protein
MILFSTHGTQSDDFYVEMECPAQEDSEHHKLDPSHRGCAKPEAVV